MPLSSPQQTVDAETRQNIDQATQPSTRVTDSTKTNKEALESELAGDGEHHALDALFE